MTKANRAHLMGTDQIDHALTHIAGQLLSDCGELTDVVILGIPSRGVPLAQRLAAKLAIMVPTFNAAGCTGQLDVTMYRDDLRSQPTRTLRLTHTPAIDNKTVVLVDDVFYSGRTVRAALDALNDLGRPAAVRLAVLVDRGHRQLPIRPDYVGGTLDTAPQQRVHVLLTEFDEVDAVVIENVAAPTDHTIAA